MEIKVKPITSEEFSAHEQSFDCANFLQTNAMFEVQAALKRYPLIEQLGLFDGDALVGITNVIYRQRYRKFLEALLMHGPLLDYSNVELVTSCYKALDNYFAEKHVAAMHTYPYVLDAVEDDGLHKRTSGLAKDLKNALLGDGFSYDFDITQSFVPNTMFMKDLSQYQTYESLYNNYSQSLKRDLRKFESMQVKVEDLGDDVETFYDVTSKTAARKRFSVQNLEYFKCLKAAFKDDAKFMYAYLDVPAYKAYIDENIQCFEAKIHELESSEQKFRTRGKIADAKDQLRSYYKRKSDFEQMNIADEKLILSSYVCMCTKQEYTLFIGGNYGEYLNFGGSPCIYAEMIKQAYEAGCKRFNFYGTIETEFASQGKGNFNFKRQFGGELYILVGEFSKTYSKTFDLISKIKH